MYSVAIFLLSFANEFWLLRFFIVFLENEDMQISFSFSHDTFCPEWIDIPLMSAKKNMNLS